MKSKFTWAGIVTALLVVITTFFVACKKDDMNEEVKYHGQVVHANTTTSYPNLPVKITDGSNTHCQTLTDAGGAFDLTVRVNEINGDYYLLAGDSTCTPKRVTLGGFGQAEVDLGIIEVAGPSVPTVVTYPVAYEKIKLDAADVSGEVKSDGHKAVTARGICYGTSTYPTVGGSHTTEGSGVGEFTSHLRDLEYNTTYYARAYATNEIGTAYGEQVEFTTGQGAPAETVKYYIKHPWGSGHDADWAWREMTDIGNGKYSINGDWGGIGANINTSPNDEGAIWYPESAILGDGYARSIGEWLTFVYDSYNNTLYAGINP